MKTYIFVLTGLILTLCCGGLVSAQDEVANAILLEDYPAIAYWIGLWNGQSDPDAYRDYLANAYQGYDTVTGKSSGGPRLVYGDIPALRQRFPDFSIRVYEVITDGDTVVVRYRAGFTIDGERAVYPGMILFRLEGAEINYAWHLYNAFPIENRPDTL